MNLGSQDAMNLGWKLAAVLNGHATERLLDTCHDERHQVAARVLENTRAQMSLLVPGENAAAMRAWMQRLLRVPDANEITSAEISGLDVCYTSHAAYPAVSHPRHPLVGRRVPDVDVVTAAGR
jgi:3-(3-hydroxy-phenyl)propionate hydroxylase